MAITDQDRKDWTQHPVTKDFLNQLYQTREEAKEAWAREQYKGKSPKASTEANARALGGVRMLDQITFELERYGRIGAEDE